MTGAGKWLRRLHTQWQKYKNRSLNQRFSETICKKYRKEQTVGISYGSRLYYRRTAPRVIVRQENRQKLEQFIQNTCRQTILHPTVVMERQERLRLTTSIRQIGRQGSERQQFLKAWEELRPPEFHPDRVEKQVKESILHLSKQPQAERDISHLLFYQEGSEFRKRLARQQEDLENLQREMKKQREHLGRLEQRVAQAPDSDHMFLDFQTQMRRQMDLERQRTGG